MRFRKKPVEIEAIQWIPENKKCKELFKTIPEIKILEDSDILIISTLEGDMIAKSGDWIIKGVNGEFYSCKPDIFDKTYERID